MKILYIQNIAALLIVLEDALSSLGYRLDRGERDRIFTYLISKILFKSGMYNTIYSNIIEKDYIVQRIRNAIYNVERDKGLGTLVIDQVVIPAAVVDKCDVGINLYLKGDTLFVIGER